ncbi:MAG: hypothetical protein AAFY99_03515 [Pseudomonadota bacterium]
MKNILLIAVGLLALVLLTSAATSYIVLTQLVDNETESEQADTFADASLDLSEVYAEKQSHKLWAEKIITGGYILHIRHAQRERWHDSAAFDAYELYSGLNPLDQQSNYYRATCLTRRGIEEARLMGKIFQLAGVKASQVISSPSCRAWMTAEEAFGENYTKENSLLPRTAMMPEQHDAFAAQLRDVLMNVEIKDGENVILTGHGATLEWDGPKVIDETEIDGSQLRQETGFYVIERVGDRLINRYLFPSLRDFATVVIELPLSSPQ